jgi:small subunit ribosomal protein S6
LRDYELVMIVSPQVADEEVAATVERVQQFIRERGGQVKDVNPWGRRKLAYPIERHLEGNYVVTHFSLDPAAVRELEENLRLSEEVLRHLVVKLEE